MAAPVATRRTSHNTVIARRLSLAKQAERKRQNNARENKSLQGSSGLRAHVQSGGGGGGLFPDSNDRSSHQTGPNAARSTSTLSHIDRQLFWGEKINRQLRQETRITHPPSPSSCREAIEMADCLINAQHNGRRHPTGH
ncbi:unnamed protein product [Ectocarpus sp. 12 AP-2014]